ncbi:MAG: hypothetical protein GY842_23435 [bacterium]|nr:hypothetical protein [bacterium]
MRTLLISMPSQARKAVFSEAALVDPAREHLAAANQHITLLERSGLVKRWRHDLRAASTLRRADGAFGIHFSAG